jgi:hypothetical protein
VGPCDADAAPRAHRQYDSSLSSWQLSHQVHLQDIEQASAQVRAFRRVVSAFAVCLFALPAVSYCLRRARGLPHRAPRRWSAQSKPKRVWAAGLALINFVMATLMFVIGGLTSEVGLALLCHCAAISFVSAGLHALSPPAASGSVRGPVAKVSESPQNALDMLLGLKATQRLLSFRATVRYDGVNYMKKLVLLEVFEVVLQVITLSLGANAMTNSTLLGTVLIMAFNMSISPLLLLHPWPFIHR